MQNRYLNYFSIFPNLCSSHCPSLVSPPYASSTRSLANDRVSDLLGCCCPQMSSTQSVSPVHGLSTQVHIGPPPPPSPRPPPCPTPCPHPHSPQHNPHPLSPGCSSWDRKIVFNSKGAKDLELERFSENITSRAGLLSVRFQFLFFNFVNFEQHFSRIWALAHWATTVSSYSASLPPFKVFIAHAVLAKGGVPVLKREAIAYLS